MSASERSKQLGIAVAIFAGGGIATYACLKFWPSRPEVRRPNDELLQQITELKREIITLQNSLAAAVTELRKELGGLQGILSGRGRTKRSNSAHTNRSSASYVTTNSYQSVGSDFDDISDDDFDVALESFDDITQRAKSPPPGSIEELEAICSKVDVLCDGTDEDKEEAMRILQDNELNVNHKNSWQLLWRLARSHIGAYDMRDAYEERSLHATTALEYARQALELKEDSSEVHKWYAISLGANTDFVGTKEKIEYGYELKEHIERALELDNNEPTLYFMKGRWCWGVYMLTWIERKLAATLFATPPSATIDDALLCFIRAEEIQPGFYKANQYYLAKCYYEMSDYDNAKKWLVSAIQLPSMNKDDRETHKEVEQLLAKL